jgi:hypothetical protein
MEFPGEIFLTHLFLSVAFIGLHLRKLHIEMIVVGVNLVSLFEHVIDAVQQIYFCEKSFLM